MHFLVVLSLLSDNFVAVAGNDFGWRQLISFSSEKTPLAL